jgi:hypothetical protein
MFADEVRGTAKRLGDAGLVAPSEASLRRSLQRRGGQAQQTLDTAQHWQHACTREANANSPSLESPHNSVKAMGAATIHLHNMQLQTQ